MSEKLEQQINESYKLKAEQLNQSSDDIQKIAAGDPEFLSSLALFTQNENSNIATQAEIILLQQQKQVIMDQLKANLALLDANPENLVWETDARTVSAKNGALEYFDRAFVACPITEGALHTGLDWGMHYAPDETIDRNVRKKYIIEEAKFALSKLWDDQISTHEISRSSNHTYLQGAYQAAKEGSHAPIEHRHFGIVAEAIVLTYIKRLIIDHHLPFTIERGDAYQDITEKIDFIIHRKKEYSREVEVTTSEDTGVQFTISTDEGVLTKKKVQLAHARRHDRKLARHIDRRLVSVPIGYVNMLLDSWKVTQHPNGPSQFIAPETAQKLFTELLRGMFSEEEIAEMWGNVRNART